MVLSLFPGIGLLDMAFEAVGFCVVRGPDLLWGGDVRRFHPPAGKFDGVIGGPPCQAFSRLRRFVEANGLTVAADLIPEFERCVIEAIPDWFVMENVPAAPVPRVPGYVVVPRLVKDVVVGGFTSRVRQISFGGLAASAAGMLLPVPLHPYPEPPVLASGGTPPGVKPTARHVATRKGAAVMGYKTTAYLRKAVRDQGLPPDFLTAAPFTVAGKIKAIGNGVPLPMGRAIARAVRQALGLPVEQPA